MFENLFSILEQIHNIYTEELYKGNMSRMNEVLNLRAEFDRQLKEYHKNLPEQEQEIVDITFYQQAFKAIYTLYQYNKPL